MLPPIHQLPELQRPFRPAIEVPAAPSRLSTGDFCEALWHFFSVVSVLEAVFYLPLLCGVLVTEGVGRKFLGDNQWEILVANNKAKMAWTTTTSYEFHNTEGQKFLCNNLLSGPGTAWSRVSEADSKRLVFQKIQPTEADIKKDHVVLFNSGVVNDKGVLELKKKAQSWDNVTKLVPGFTEEMLLVADLIYLIDPYMVDKLNTILAESSLAQVNHVLYAIHRLGDKYRSTEEKLETKNALKKCIMDVGGLDEDTADAIRDQWPKCWKWTKPRVTFAHPLLQAELSDLQKLKNEIGVEPAYAEIREAAIFMVDLLVMLKTLE